MMADHAQGQGRVARRGSVLGEGTADIVSACGARPPVRRPGPTGRDSVDLDRR